LAVRKSDCRAIGVGVLSVPVVCTLVKTVAVHLFLGGVSPVIRNFATTLMGIDFRLNEPAVAIAGIIILFLLARHGRT
jgi:ABC-type proline/glycine betaine transport system permease subunit